MKNKVQEELKQHFRPEFLNRIDDIVVFHQLSEAEIVQIVDLMVAKLDERLRDKDMGVELTPAAKSLLATQGYDPVLGRRPLRRTIQREIEDALSEKILFSSCGPARSSWSTPRARVQASTSSSRVRPRRRCRTCLPWRPPGRTDLRRTR
jgi:ATP-dependent Clp protease ATP-binding subunit ClpC